MPQRHRATETERPGDKATRRRGDRAKSLSACHPVSPPVAPSPSRPVPVAMWLCGKFIGLAATVAMALSFANACSQAPGKSFDIDKGSRPATLAADEPEPPRVY